MMTDEQREALRTRRWAEYLYLIWDCTFCGFTSRVSLRERMNGDFPTSDDYGNYKPFSCYHCGSHEHFEFRESHHVTRAMKNE